MDKNTENAIVNAIGELHVSLDEMKKTMNIFGEKVLDKLESIDGKLSYTTNLKQEVDRHSVN